MLSGDLTQMAHIDHQRGGRAAQGRLAGDKAIAGLGAG
jgi:hypothetical protein